MLFPSHTHTHFRTLTESFGSSRSRPHKKEGRPNFLMRLQSLVAGSTGSLRIKANVSGLMRSIADIFQKIRTTSLLLPSLMPRSHIHGLDAELATNTIRHWTFATSVAYSYWSVAFRIVSVIIRSSTYLYSASVSA